MTLQEIFDRVATHLLKQNEQSSDGRSCLYRAPDGKMCAVGCLITQDAYDPEIENNDIDDPDVQDAVRNSGVNIDDGDVHQLLYELQDMHDQYMPDRWRARLPIVAGHFELDTKVVDSTP